MGAVVRLAACSGCGAGVLLQEPRGSQRPAVQAMHPPHTRDRHRPNAAAVPSLPVTKLLGERPGPAALRLFDDTCENPELIWTKQMKAELQDVLSQLLMAKLEVTRRRLLPCHRHLVVISTQDAPAPAPR